jgi:hypothetical protein
VHISLNSVNDLIISLFTKIKELYDLDSPRLSAEMKQQMFEALESLNAKASKVIISNLVPNTFNLQNLAKTEYLQTNEAMLIKKYSSFLEELEKDEEIQKEVTLTSILCPMTYELLSISNYEGLYVSVCLLSNFLI